MKMEKETDVMCLQTWEPQRLPATHQKPKERHRTDFPYSPEKNKLAYIKIWDLRPPEL